MGVTIAWSSLENAHVAGNIYEPLPWRTVRLIAALPATYGDELAAF